VFSTRILDQMRRVYSSIISHEEYDLAHIILAKIIKILQAQFYEPLLIYYLWCHLVLALRHIEKNEKLSREYLKRIFEISKKYKNVNYDFIFAEFTKKFDQYIGTKNINLALALVYLFSEVINKLVTPKAVELQAEFCRALVSTMIDVGELRHVDKVLGIMEHLIKIKVSANVPVVYASILVMLISFHSKNQYFEKNERCLMRLRQLYRTFNKKELAEKYARGLLQSLLGAHKNPAFAKKLCTLLKELEQWAEETETKKIIQSIVSICKNYE
ncbi:MAG: hypothetical protein QXL15_03055, partial [Candidatus Korarchaeota archaeon]